LLAKRNTVAAGSMPCRARVAARCTRSAGDRPAVSTGCGITGSFASGSPKRAAISSFTMVDGQITARSQGLVNIRRSAASR
jgi:hypothetical protein